ncbi:helix-turn-helix domain-containing protein [Dactylosporangium sp. NPDC050688]|uniref:PucR family transcriptional regulator n=1 Tax=Dactylosporangium sp. NPDC050688 TaxID=3157217 RepID=UPI0033EF18B1
MVVAHRAHGDGPDLSRIAAAASSDAGGVDPELLGGFLPAVVAATAAGRRLRRRELEACATSGRRAAVRGVALRALVDLYLSAAWRLWRDVPQVAAGDGDRVRDAALAVLRAADDGVAALVEGFQLARADVIRLQESVKHDVLEALLAGGQQAIEATGPAADIGLTLTGPVAVLVARRPAGFGGPDTAAAPGRLERALQGRHGDAQPLVLIRSGELVCVFAAPDAAAVQAVRDIVVRELDGQIRDELAPRSWRGAVSSPRIGAAAVRTSHDEARYALGLADRLGLEQPVADARDLTIYRVLLQDLPAVHDLVRSTLTPLTRARGGAAHLVETLDAYYATGCVATETAARLNLSVRAVTYRLARVAELTGRDPSEPAERLTLHAAVTAARLLDWPATPLEG